MTTIYVPRLIESAEQAKALPDGTVARYKGVSSANDSVTVRVPGGWYDDSEFTTGPMSHDEVLDWTALVPIEVEVEQIRESGGRRRSKTVYVTPWTTPGVAEPGGDALVEGGGPR